MISLTKELILQRMECGEKLRWISDQILDDRETENIRYLFIGKDELDNESALDALELCIDGEILEEPHHRRSNFIYYSLV